MGEKHLFSLTGGNMFTTFCLQDKTLWISSVDLESTLDVKSRAVSLLDSEEDGYFCEPALIVFSFQIYSIVKIS